MIRTDDEFAIYRKIFEPDLLYNLVLKIGEIFDEETKYIECNSKMKKKSEPHYERIRRLFPLFLEVGPEFNDQSTHHNALRHLNWMRHS